jgi:hypothetical protein
MIMQIHKTTDTGQLKIQNGIKVEYGVLSEQQQKLDCTFFLHTINSEEYIIQILHHVVKFKL